jgi:hypothetical protein
VEHAPAEDEAEIAEIVRGFLAVQARTAADESRALERGTHAKGVYARAVFDVLDVAMPGDSALARRCRAGIYAKPGSYPATVRFANSGANVNTDWQPDVRSMSFSVAVTPFGRGTGSAQARQDYSLQSAPTLPFNDVHAFAVFARVAGAPNETIAASSLPFRDQLVFARTKLAVLQQQQRQEVRPYQRLRYWSNVPFRHGASDIVKYSAWPAAANPAAALDRRSPNALRDELIRHVNEDAVMSAFDFGLQFLDVESMTYQGTRRDASFWIENASVEWPEDQAPFHVVARLTLVPHSTLPADASAAMYIDVTEHSAAEHAPVGRVNRARWHAEVASRTARQGTA